MAGLERRVHNGSLLRFFIFSGVCCFHLANVNDLRVREKAFHAFDHQILPCHKTSFGLKIELLTSDLRDKLSNLKLRGGASADDPEIDQNPLALSTRKKKKKKKSLTLADKMHHEPWRKMNPEAELPDGLEIRKMTQEGHHILRVGEVWSKRGIKLREREAKIKQKEKHGLKKRQKAISHLEQVIKDQKAGVLPSGNLPTKPVKELQKDLQNMKNELIRYKDALYGTGVWKAMTAHTVPLALRHLDDFKKGDDVALYKALTETRSIVFNHHKASSAKPEVPFPHFRHTHVQRLASHPRTPRPRRLCRDIRRRARGVESGGGSCWRIDGRG